jgi:MFS family permease
VILGLVVFAVTTPLFILVQARRRYPLVDLRLFADRGRSAAYVATLLLSLARFAVVLLIALYLQAARGLDPFGAGIRVIPVALGMAIASPFAGRLVDRWSARLLATIGMGTTGAGLLALAVRLQPTTNDVELALWLGLIGVGTGIFMTPNTSSIMASVEPARRGIANGVRSMLQNSGYAVSIALSLGIVTSALPANEKREAYAGTLSRLGPTSLEQLTHGFHVALYVLAGITVLGGAVSLLRGNAQGRAGPVEPD